MAEKSLAARYLEHARQLLELAALVKNEAHADLLTRCAEDFMRLAADLDERPGRPN